MFTTSCCPWLKNVSLKRSRVRSYSSVPLTHHDPKDLGLTCLVKKRKIHFRILSDFRIQFWIFLKKRTLKSYSLPKNGCFGRGCLTMNISILHLMRAKLFFLGNNHDKTLELPLIRSQKPGSFRF